MEDLGLPVPLSQTTELVNRGKPHGPLTRHRYETRDAPPAIPNAPQPFFHRLRTITTPSSRTAVSYL